MMEDIALSEETRWLTEGNPAFRRYYTTETYDLNIFDDGDRQPRMDDFRETGFGIILGMTGSGKTNTAEVLMESFLDKRVPIIVLDIKNEYYTLREKYRIKVIGDCEHYDEKLSQTDPKALASRVVNGKESVVLSFFQIPKAGIFKFCIPFLQEVYDLEKSARYPIMIFAEESQVFLPQKLPFGFKDEAKQLKGIMEEIALRGRSIGISAFFISQRSQSVDKDIITQAEHMFLHRVVHPRDQEIYKDLIPFESRLVVYTIPKLARGSCVYVHKGEAAIRQVRKKYSRDVSAAPGYDRVLKYMDSLRSDEDENMPKLEKCSICGKEVDENEGFWIGEKNNEKFVCYKCRGKVR